LTKGQTGLDERVLEQAMVGPGRLEHDPGDCEALQLFEEGAMAFRRVGDAEVLAFGRDRDIESVFGNVNRAQARGRRARSCPNARSDRRLAKLRVDQSFALRIGLICNDGLASPSQIDEFFGRCNRTRDFGGQHAASG
jgi:hypothetical protein